MESKNGKYEIRVKNHEVIIDRISDGEKIGIIDCTIEHSELYNPPTGELLYEDRDDLISSIISDGLYYESPEINDLIKIGELTEEEIGKAINEAMPYIPELDKTN